MVNRGRIDRSPPDGHRNGSSASLSSVFFRRARRPLPFCSRPCEAGRALWSRSTAGVVALAVSRSAAASSEPSRSPPAFVAPALAPAFRSLAVVSGSTAADGFGAGMAPVGELGRTGSAVFATSAEGLWSGALPGSGTSGASALWLQAPTVATTAANPTLRTDMQEALRGTPLVARLRALGLASEVLARTRKNQKGRIPGATVGFPDSPAGRSPLGEVSVAAVGVLGRLRSFRSAMSIVALLSAESVTAVPR